MSQLAATLRRARDLYLNGRVTTGTVTDGWGREGSRRSDRYGVGLGGKLVFWTPLLLDAAGGDTELMLVALELLDQCSPGGWFELYADGARLLWDGEHLVGLVYDVERKPAEVAAIIGKACVLAEARASAPKPWLRMAKADEPAPAPVVPAGPPPRSSRFDGFTQDPEEGNE